MTPDFIILGYGPVGATLAALLTRRGHSVLVVEQSLTVYDKPRAITLDHEALRVLQSAGLAEDIKPFIAPHTGTNYLGVDGAIIRIFDPMPPPFPLGWIPNACFLQPQLEAALRARVDANGGADILLGHRATALTQDATGVTLTVQDGNGTERSIAGKYLLACDGANSFARRQLGIGVEDLAFDEWWMVVDTRIQDGIDLPKKSMQYCSPSRPSTFVVGPHDLRRWEIKLLPGEDPDAFGKPENVRRHIGRFADLSKLEIWRSAVYRFHAIVADRWRQDRVFLLGDACHQMPPFLGQGLCGGIRDAANLAWKLELVMAGVARDDLLDSYESERKPHIRTVVAHAKEFGEVIGELDPERALARDRRLRAEIARGQAETVRQKYIPNLAGGVIDTTSGSAGGTLFVQPRVRTTHGEMLLDDTLRPRFLLATRDDDAQRWMTPRAREIWQRLAGERVVIASDAAPAGIPSDVLHVTEQDGLFAGWMRQHQGVAALVRPDGYAYAVVRDAAGLNAAIERLGAQILA